MEHIPNVLKVTTGNCLGLYSRIDNINNMPAWASNKYIIFFDSNNWLITELNYFADVLETSNAKILHTSNNWPEVETIE